MQKFNQVKDSGNREEFSTGSVRDIRDGKGRFDLISPIAIKRLAQHYENGAKKYGDRNWEKGQPLSRYIDSLIRHAYCLLEGKNDEDHAAAIMWNAAAFIHTQQNIWNKDLPIILDDMPKKKILNTRAGEIAFGVGSGFKHNTPPKENSVENSWNQGEKNYISGGYVGPGDL